jgi:hypothetical protein
LITFAETPNRLKNMTKKTAILLLLFTTVFATSQNKEKIKGSKTVTIEQKEIGNFESLEIEDNIEIYLEKGEKNEIKIEADNNLHEVISFDLKAKNLRIYTSKAITSYKKFIVKVTYTNELKTITAKNEAIINAIAQIQLDNITINTLDFSKVHINVNAKNFTLKSNDKSKVELNLKSEKATIELSKSASLKALVYSTEFKCDLYQKTTAAIEGDATIAFIRLDNNTIFTGTKFTLKEANLIAENNSICSIYAITTFALDAANNAEITLFGTPKIEIKKFADEVKLYKKTKI